MDHKPSPSLQESSPPRRFVTREAFVLCGLLLLLFALLFDWNWFKGTVERRVEATTGREFRIEGDLDVDWSWFRPTVTADGVVLGNADWASSGQDLLRIERAEIELVPWSLLFGDLRLPEVRLHSPALNLERDAEGRVNWRFDDEPGGDTIPTATPRIDQLLIEGGRLHLLEPERRTDLAIHLQSIDAATAGGFAPLRLSGEGRYRGNAFTLEGAVSSPLELADADQRFQIDLAARAASTRIRARGGLDTPLQLQDFDLGFGISGGDMAQLYPLLGLALPHTSAYALEGRLARTGSVWSYRGVSGVVGDSDIAGDVNVDTGRERTLLTADLVSKRLDFDDLAGFVGGKPQAGEGARTAPALSGGKLFPSRDYDLSKLRAMDADVRLRADQLNAPGLPLEAMDARLLLVDGEVTLDPFDFAAAGGDLGGRIHLDARTDPISARIDLRGRRLELPKLFPDGAPESTGRVGGRVQISGRGNSVAALMATADGDIGLAMGRGRISNLTLELAGLDVAEALKFMLGKDQVVPVRCGYAEFRAKGGVLETRALAFDTTDTLLLGEGSIDLRDESLDLVLRPRPKDASPFSLRSPLRVRGTLVDPSIRPQGGPLLLRGAAAVALFSVAPPAALLALIETGPGENADCGGDSGNKSRP